MKQCKKCQERIPNFMEIDGITRNLSKRSFCVKCSPFNSHNTRDITQRTIHENCLTCEKPLKNKRRRYCQACIKKKARFLRKQEIMNITGYSCWTCDFTCKEEGAFIMHFHHMNGIEKDAAISMMISNSASLETILPELKKCIMVCPTCHALIHHTEIYPQDKLEEIHKIKWAEIS